MIESTACEGNGQWSDRADGVVGLLGDWLTWCDGLTYYLVSLRGAAALWVGISQVW